ncbi:MAG: hypothetical protein Ta2G_01760 [Termitinemataceae bacterium]|nr:MAG: hypothetical protein Ta2G_01760 [Termitinemataceae bacterium]
MPFKGEGGLFADNESGGGKRLLSLKDNINAILHGSAEEKRALRGKHFYLLDTPAFMKIAPINLNGDYFTVGYGVIAKHKNKDDNHKLTAQNWLDLQDAIKVPFVITKYNDGCNLYTSVKINDKNILVGAEVKRIGRNVAVNSIRTAFGARNIKGDIVYMAKDITPTQAGLLGVTNLPPLQPAQNATSSLSTQSSEKSSGDNLGDNLGVII